MTSLHTTLVHGRVETTKGSTSLRRACHYAVVLCGACLPFQGISFAQSFSGTYTFTSTSGTLNPFAYNGTDILNLTEGGLTRGSGLTPSSSSGNFRSSNYTTTSTLDANDYMEFTLTAAPSYTLTMSSITFGIGNSATGPKKWEWRSSVDNYAAAITTYSATNAGLSLSSGVLTSGSNSNWTGNVLSLSGGSYSNLSAVTFRLYAYQSGASGGTGGLQGPLSFAGTMNVPTSGNYWAPGVGGGGSGIWTTGGTIWASSAGTQGSLTQATSGQLVFGDTAGTVTVGDTVTASSGLQIATSGYLLTGGTISLSGTSAASNTITVDTSVSGTIDSILAGSAGLTKAGAGTLALGGANTLSGTVAVSAGILATTTSGVIADAATVSVATAATLQLGGNETVAAVLGSGTVNVQASTLTVNPTVDGTFAGVVQGTGGLTKAGAATFTLSGGNTYSGATTVSGGILATSGAERIGNSSAVTVASGATLQLGGAETVGSLAGAGTVSIGANAFTAGAAGTTTTFDGVIQGSGGTFTKAGAGGLTFTGNNTYTGATTISGGTLALSGAGAIASNSISVGSGAAFDVTAVTGGYTLTSGKTVSGVGSVVGPMTLGNGSTISPGATTGSIGTLTSGDLVLSGGGTYAFNLADTTTGAGVGWDLLSSAAVTLPSSSFTIDVSGAATGFSTSATQSWRILAATSLAGSFDANNFTVVRSSFPNLGGGTLSITDSGTAGTGLYLLFTPSANQLWLGGTGGSGTWATTGGTNWSGGAWQDGLLGTFQGTAGTVTVETANVGKGLTFATSDYVLTGGTLTFTGTAAAANPITVASGSARIDSTLAGVTGLQKLGAGTLILGGANTLTGTIDVSVGELATGAGGAIADGADVTVAAAASLALGAAETIGSLAGSGTVRLGASTLTTGASGATTTFAGVLEGTGGLTKAGAGTFTLSGSQTYTGATTVDGGVLALASAERLADGSALVVNAAGTVQLGGAETVGSLAGAGSVTLAGTLTAGGDGTNSAFTGVITGSGSLVKSGVGTLSLGGANGYSGSTTISGGTLATTAPGVIPDTSVVTVNAGASLALGAAETIGSLAGAGTVDVGPSGLTSGGLNAAESFPGSLVGAGSYTKVGTGTMTLSGTNTVAGITVSAGRLTIASAGALPTAGTVAVNDAGRLSFSTSGTFGGSGQTITLAANQATSPMLDILSSSTVSLASTVQLAGSSLNQIGAYAPGSLTLAGNLTGSGGLLKVGSGNLVLSGTANTNAGATELAAGTLTVAAGSALGTGDLRLSNTTSSLMTLALQESVTVGNLSSGYVGTGNSQITITAGKTLTVNQAVTGTFGAPNGNQTTAIIGAGGFTKAGAGGLTLAGVNAVTGPTTVSAGELITAVANAISSDVTVSSGATLTLGAAQTFTSLAGAGTLAAGSRAMTFSLASDATFGGTLTGSPSSSLTKAGPGTLNFTGTTSGYQGAVTVNEGAITGLSFGSGTVAMNGGNAFGGNGATIASSFSIGSTGVTTVPFVAYWDMQTEAPTTTSGSGLSFGPIVQGNNNGTTAILSTTSPSSGYITAGGVVASGSSNAAASARAGVFSGSSAYFAVTLTGSDGVTLSLGNVQMGSRSTSTGPLAYDLRSSIDGYASSLATGALGNNSTWVAYQSVPAATSGTGAVTYRIYGVSGTGSPSAGTANWRVDDLSLSGSTTFFAVNRASATLGIAEAGATTFTGDVAVTGTAVLSAVAGGTATFSGAIGGTNGAVAKTGAGTVILSGTSSYGGTTTVSQGVLTVLGGGKLAGTSAVTVAGGARLRNLGVIGTSGSNTAVIVNGVLSGNGRVFGTVGGSGSVDPGSSPGILTLEAVDPGAGLDHNFEFTSLSPDYTTSGTGALNDIVHLVGASPFVASLSGTAGNDVNVYLNSAAFAEGATFVGGFFADASASLSAFLADVSGAQYNYFVASPGGGVLYEGIDYLSLADWNTANSRNLSIEVGGQFVANAAFPTGTTSGYATTFTVVPEPSTLALAGLGLVAAAGAVVRRRAGGRQPLRARTR